MERPFGKPIKSKAVMAPVTIELSDQVSHIFSVPETGAVGTNDLDNAITFLRFHGDAIEWEQVVGDFFPYVGAGDFRFLPVIGHTHIGYSQTRGFVLVDIPHRSVDLYTICTSLEETVEGVAVLDDQKKQFMFQIRTAADPDPLKVLRIVECRENSEAILIDEALVGIQGIGYNEPWLLHDGKVLVYQRDPGELHTLGLDFQLDTHPLARLFNASRDRFRRLDQVVVHPVLPFAVLVEIDEDSRGDYVIWLARWEHAEQEQRLIPLYPSPAQSAVFDFSCSGLQFSPDGGWLLLRDHTARDAGPSYLALPVERDNEYFLGQPKNLGSLPRPGLSEAWISRPLSFVVTDGQTLYKWDFRKLPYV